MRIQLENRGAPGQTGQEADDAAEVMPQAAWDASCAAFYSHSMGTRTNTDAMMFASLSKQYPRQKISVLAPTGNVPSTGGLLAFASATGRATFSAIVDPSDPNTSPLEWKTYVPPARRLDNEKGEGSVAAQIKFGKYSYRYGDQPFILYVADGRDGLANYPILTLQYLIHPDDGGATAALVDDLVREAGDWARRLHNEIWVFDGGIWRKDAELWRSVSKASWDDVILDPAEKKALREDTRRFFDGRERYERLRVAWKRGVIYHGPPGNGKTVSIKAMMHELNRHKPTAVPTLYVRTLSSFGGPEMGIKQIFTKARQEAPCLLVFEDLDSIVTDDVRSYFLNEVDGLAVNEGVMMVGSTNHLDRLDPGLSKRPSRFDRKFLFPKPDFAGRVRYAEYWRHKLQGSDEIEFPEKLNEHIARITDDFSFAYIQEAFVATLLALAAKEDDDEDAMRDSDPLDKLVLWREFKKQVKVLREEM